MKQPYSSSTPRTPLLRFLQHTFRLAVWANEPGAPTPEALVAQAAASRRRFVTNTAKVGLLAGVGGVLTACEAALEEPAAPKTTAFGNAATQPRIVVVGAGVAGLNCAYQLSKAGLRADVYEASNRVGGRIFTAPGLMAPGVTTELGGEFIDSGHRDMLQLAQEFGLPLLDVEAASETALIKDTYFFRGRHYTVAEVVRAFQPYAAQITADIRSLPNTITFENYGNAARLDNLSIAAYFDSLGMTGLIRELLDVAYVTEYGRETAEQTSINFLWLFSPDTKKDTFDVFGISDERYKIRGGNQRLTDALAQRLPGQLTLEHKLVALGQRGAQYELRFERPDGSALTVVADYVVLTVPFSVLRNVALNLPLPAWKLNAIQNLNYGTNTKLFLGFNSRPWRARGYTGYLFSDRAAQSGWDSSQLQPGAGGVYTVYLGGQQGVSLGTGSPQAQVSTYLPVLEAVWPGCQAAYNGRVERFHWPTHPFTRGSYACYRPGDYTTMAGAERKPVDNLFFAGEHCSLDFQGFMNGAAETGRVAAEDVARAVRGQKVAWLPRLRAALSAVPA